ncbi:hypothetical protein K1T35_22955 [Pseudonocardia sp. DSM 110487]|uniref:hypothetical protein n=1 Tax=Pseudonocardia sp. DSM 110487 TaxID=2865833 RepID=UPI001C69E4CB|nr:hypothetical protein [Pseudonocardia sp. DSM 110487]QYN39794.1 hypothetical protein K1T35_22955 [Pseudonocardia sp. DSM 110487]
MIVDGANVVGSRPDGWWRDREGAARRLAGRIVAALTTDRFGLAEAFGHPGADLRVHLVLEGAAARVEDLPSHPALTIVRARADGDSMIVAVATDLIVDGSGAAVIVVTADRALREQVRGSGAATTGPGTLLNALPAP